jgi:hypothetical protein
MTVTKHETYTIDTNGGSIVLDPFNKNIWVHEYPKLFNLYTDLKDAYRNDNSLLSWPFPLTGLGGGGYVFENDYEIYHAHRFRNGFLSNPKCAQVRFLSSVSLDDALVYVNGYRMEIHDGFSRLPEYLSSKVDLKIVAIKDGMFWSLDQTLHEYQPELVFPILFTEPRGLDLVSTMGTL